MKTASDLRHELGLVFDQLRAGLIKPQEASELANVAGKMISSAKVQVEYYGLRKLATRIAFLEETQ